MTQVIPNHIVSIHPEHRIWWRHTALHLSTLENNLGSIVPSLSLANIALWGWREQRWGIGEFWTAHKYNGITFQDKLDSGWTKAIQFLWGAWEGGCMLLAGSLTYQEFQILVWQFLIRRKNKLNLELLAVAKSLAMEYMTSLRAGGSCLETLSKWI